MENAKILNVFTFDTEKRLISVAVSTEAITDKHREYITNRYGKILEIYSGTGGGSIEKIIFLDF